MENARQKQGCKTGKVRNVDPPVATKTVNQNQRVLRRVCGALEAGRPDGAPAEVVFTLTEWELAGGPRWQLGEV